MKGIRARHLLLAFVVGCAVGFNLGLFVFEDNIKRPYIHQKGG